MSYFSDKIDSLFFRDICPVFSMKGRRNPVFDTNTNVLTVFMISLLVQLLQEYEEHETYWEHQYGMGDSFFFCLGKRTIS